MRTGEELWDLWLSPDNNSLLVVTIFVVLIHHGLVVIIVILVLRTPEVCEFSKSFLKSSGFEAISGNDDQVNFIRFENFLEGLFVGFMILLLINIILGVEGSAISHSFSWRTRFSRWQNMQEVFLLDKFAILIYNSNGCLVIPLVDLVDASSHDDKALSLRDKLIDVSIGVLIFDLSLVELVSLNLEVAIPDLLGVVFTTFSKHMILCVFFQFCFDVI